MLEPTDAWLTTTTFEHAPEHDLNAQIGDSRAMRRHQLLIRHPWVQEWLTETFQDGFARGVSSILQSQHQAAHKDIPQTFIRALQRGPGPVSEHVNDALVRIDGIEVSVTVSKHGTGRPDPDVDGAWKGLCTAVRAITKGEYCPHALAALPPEIASAYWNHRGDPSKPVHVRGHS